MIGIDTNVLVRYIAQDDGKTDFADCLVERSAMAAGCKSVVTFDKRSAKAGMTLLK